MRTQWPSGWLDLANDWKLSPEALVWGYRLYQAAVEYRLPLVPNRSGWSQFGEFEYRQRAWAQTEAGRRFFKACSGIERYVQRECVPEFERTAADASPDLLKRLRGQRYRLLSVPNSGWELPFIGTDPPEIVLYSFHIFSSNPLHSVASFWFDWWLANTCIRCTIERIIQEPYKNSVLALKTGEATTAEQIRHLKTVRARLLQVAEQRKTQGIDLVGEERFHDYVMEEIYESPHEIYDFQERLLAGKVASPHGFICDVKNDLQKWRWKCDPLDDPDLLSHPENVEDALHVWSFEEAGRLLDRGEEALEHICGAGASQIAWMRYKFPELTDKQIADLLGMSDTKIRRTKSRARAKRQALNHRFETNWRPTKKR